MFAVLSFVITFLLTPIFAKKLERRGIVGTDLHKKDGRKVPEMVGLAVLAGFLLSISLAYALHRKPEILITLLLVSLVGILGIADRFKALTPLQKVVFLTLIGFLLIPFSIPTIGGCELGIIYFIALPVFFMIACNFTNMLAGFNGLEIGTGAIASLGVAAIAYMNKAEVSFVISSVMFASLLAFLYFNKYPARVFPGDVGTLIIGAALFPAIVFGKFELSGAIVFIPYAIDAALKYFSAGIMTRESQVPTGVKDGKLYIPHSDIAEEGANLSLPRLFLRRRAMGENELVHRVWAVEAVFCLIAIGAELVG
ncbi:MAG: glycosyltransferase 4 family protein [Methanobacteriota archaeon]